MNHLLSALLCCVITAASVQGTLDDREASNGLEANEAQSQVGDLTGCIVDSPQGLSLPGAQVMISRGPDSRRVVTDASGCYAVSGVDAGEYVIEATLAGFKKARRFGVAVRPRETTRVDFSLCVAALAEVHWVLPASFEDLVKSADAVVHLRVTATRLEPTCENGWLHSAQVLAVAKPAGGLAAQSIEFSQAMSGDELTPYPVGTEMVVGVAFGRESRPAERMGGPFGVYKEGVVVRARDWGTSRYDGMRVEAFLEALRNQRQ